MAEMENQTAQTQPYPTMLVPAGFWLRAVAWLLDAMIVSVLAGLLFAITFSSVAGLVAAWLYYALSESSRYQATLGKRALGLIVVTEKYETPSFARASGRFFAKILSCAIFFVGFLMAAFTEQRQALHDIIAECLVLKSR